MNLEKFVGKTIEVIYLGHNGEISQRWIEVRKVQDGIIKAFCLQAKAPRLFRVENILAVQLTNYRKSS